MRWSKAVVVGYLAVLVVLAGAHSFAEEPLVRRPSGRLMPGQWLTEVAKLTASDAGSGDLFGTLWTNGNLSGDTAVIGAYLDDHTGGTDAGSAYVYTRSGGSWDLQETLTASDGEAGDLFGFHVALSGDTAVVGACWDDHSGYLDAGSAYIFTRTGDSWTEQQKLIASDPGDGDEFGVVAISGETILVGASGDDHSGYVDAGSVYVFTRSGTTWTERQKATASDPGDGDLFGWGIPVSGDTVITGAPMDDHSGLTDADSVYIFNLAQFVDGFESGDTAAWSAVGP